MDKPMARFDGIVEGDSVQKASKNKGIEYGLEDGNIYDQETIEISTTTVCNTATRKPGRGPQTGKI